MANASTIVASPSSSVTQTNTDYLSQRSSAGRENHIQRNQSPGIIDRRRSLRPSASASLRGGRGNRRSVGIPIRISMADMASEMKLKDDDDDDNKAVRPSSIRVKAERKEMVHQ